MDPAHASVFAFTRANSCREPLRLIQFPKIAPCSDLTRHNQAIRLPSMLPSQGVAWHSTCLPALSVHQKPG